MEDRVSELEKLLARGGKYWEPNEEIVEAAKDAIAYFNPVLEEPSIFPDPAEGEGPEPGRLLETMEEEIARNNKNWDVPTPDAIVSVTVKEPLQTAEETFDKALATSQACYELREEGKGWDWIREAVKVAAPWDEAKKWSDLMGLPAFPGERKKNSKLPAGEAEDCYNMYMAGASYAEINKQKGLRSSHFAVAAYCRAKGIEVPKKR